MVPVSGETKTESSTEFINTEPINFILTNEFGYGKYGTLPNISYKGDIDTIQHDNEIIDNNILIGKSSYLLKVRAVSSSALKSIPVLPSSTKIWRCS